VFSISASGDCRACDHSLILPITRSARGLECADALQLATGDETHWAHLLQGQPRACANKITPP
jgi:hypothetical protein